jgi:hypothetical protein
MLADIWQNRARICLSSKRYYIVIGFVFFSEACGGYPGGFGYALEILISLNVKKNIKWKLKL